MNRLIKINYSQAWIETLSGLTISTALVPEAISFALLVGVSPQAGLWAAFFMAISTSLFGGRPGIISGATGATAVILASLVTLHGEEHLYQAVLFAGLIQFVVWISNLWKVFKYIPTVVIHGFLIALAILIFVSQFKYLEIGNPSGFDKILLIFTIIISAAAMYFSKKYFSFPPALSAILVGSFLGITFGLSTVGDLSSISSALPSLTIPEITISSMLLVLPYSFGMAISGLTESLITVDEVSNKLGKINDLDPKKSETFAQAVGNTISGIFTAIGGCVLVGQTNLNVSAGARHRLSSFVASLGLLAIILIFGKYIERIPLAGLIGVMMIVVIQTGKWSALKSKSFKTQISLISTIISSLLTHNLAIGVIVGTFIFYSFKKYEHIWQRKRS